MWQKAGHHFDYKFVNKDVPGGSYWDWLKKGGGLAPNNPFPGISPFPGTPQEEAPETVGYSKPSWGSQFPLDRLTIA